MSNETTIGQQVRSNDELGVTADGIAYRLARELEDLIELAAAAMRQANMDGAEYEVEDELASARLAIAAYQTFSSSTAPTVAANYELPPKSADMHPQRNVK